MIQTQALIALVAMAHDNPSTGMIMIGKPSNLMRRQIDFAPLAYLQLYKMETTVVITDKKVWDAGLRPRFKPSQSEFAPLRDQ
jgi:hypothetical protein